MTKFKIFFSLLYLFCTPMVFANPRTVPHHIVRPNISKIGFPRLSQRIATYKINTLLGLNVSKGSALVSGFQIGKSLSKQTPIYLAAEANFSLFSAGSLLAIMVGGWYEFYPFSSPRLSLSLGAVAGPGFSTQLDDYSATSFVGFLDAALAQEVDDLVKMRLQFRPGIMSRHFAFMVNLNISFCLG